MKIVLQRVLNASVVVAGETIGCIGKGYLVLLGIGGDDTTVDIEKIVEKIRNLRIFSDENGKINRSIGDIDGEILVVSQFTLYADCKKGNRPSFSDAAPADLAKKMYEDFLLCCDGKFKKVAHGKFGAEMQVSLVNDGPFTILL